MLSFHNDAAVKEKYLSRVVSHRKADAIIQGTGWENGKGCAVGCTLENYDHSRYPIELGLPEWLARLEDIIFEELPKKEAAQWPEKFLSVIPVGVDVEIVRHQLAIRRLDRLIKLQTDNLEKNNDDIKKVILQTIDAINLVKKCHESEIKKDYCDLESAAESASSAARSAVWSAVWSAAWQQEANDLLELLSECK